MIVLSTFSEIISPIKAGSSFWSQESLNFDLILKFSLGVSLCVTCLSIMTSSPSDKKQSSGNKNNVISIYNQRSLFAENEFHSKDHAS